MGGMSAGVFNEQRYDCNKPPCITKPLERCNNLRKTEMTSTVDIITEQCGHSFVLLIACAGDPFIRGPSDPLSYSGELSTCYLISSSCSAPRCLYNYWIQLEFR